MNTFQRKRLLWCIFSCNHVNSHTAIKSLKHGGIFIDIKRWISHTSHSIRKIHFYTLNAVKTFTFTSKWKIISSKWVCISREFNCVIAGEKSICLLLLWDTPFIYSDNHSSFLLYHSCWKLEQSPKNTSKPWSCRQNSMKKKPYLVSESCEAQ